MIIEVRAFSRLHFGLLEISPGQPHCYGGVGMMIDSPSMTVQAVIGSANDRHAVRVEGDAYWSERTRRALDAWQSQNPGTPIDVQSIRIVSPPEPHIGLGSGTQWACSIAGLLQLARIAQTPSDGLGHAGLQDARWRDLFPSAQSLAKQAGRGLRSHIGAEGFRSGGGIVDWGHGEPCQALAFPSEWRMVTLCDRSYQGESGLSEAKIFARCETHPNPHREEMIRLIRDEMVPALDARDWTTASHAIGRYGEWAGKIFEPLQGGIYRSPAIAQCIAHLRALGMHGVGQSSWGPTVFALASDAAHAAWIVDAMQQHIATATEVRITRTANAARYAVEPSS